MAVANCAAVRAVNARLYELDRAEREPVSLVRVRPANDPAPVLTAEERARIEALLVSTGFA